MTSWNRLIFFKKKIYYAMRRLSIFALASLVILCGCTSSIPLTKEGKKVEYIEIYSRNDEDVKENCEFIKKIRSSGNAPTMENDFRNKTAELGGDTVVFPGAQFSTDGTFFAKAYDCSGNMETDK